MSNNHHRGGPSILVLYKITNHPTDQTSGSPHYNALELPRSTTPSQTTLSYIQRHISALTALNPLGPQGYHWRVRIDDATKGPKGSSPVKYSWWDIQDEHARLPVREVSLGQIKDMLAPPPKKKTSSSGDSGVDSVSKGIRSLGKAMNKVASQVEASTTSSGVHDSGGPMVPIVLMKLVDLVQLQKDHSGSSMMAQGGSGVAPKRSVTARPAAARGASQPRQSRQPAAAGSAGAGAQQRRPAPTQRRPQPRTATAELMDFGSGPTTTTTTPSTPSARTTAVPPPPSVAPTAKPAETRAQKLKREYEQKKQSQNRVWDEVDQRWVTVDAKPGQAVRQGTTAAPPSHGPSSASASSSKPKIKAVSLDNVNTTGKSAAVAQAVHARVNDMKAAQQKALEEVRQREQSKKQSEAEEDLVRQALEPKIKAWSEEHGKKKQLRALLASLHTILWPEAKWKPVNLGDLLDEKKCRLAFHKASRVVHPDKTMHLSAENRFLAKRIFDALSQAKSELG